MTTTTLVFIAKLLESLSGPRTTSGTSSVAGKPKEAGNYKIIGFPFFYTQIKQISTQSLQHFLAGLAHEVMDIKINDKLA